jgi:hypothetical protein
MGKILMVTTLAALFTACTPNNDNEVQDGGFDFEAFFAEFQENKSAWENLGLEHYCYTVEHACRPPIWDPSLTITVFSIQEPEITEIDGWPVTAEALVQLEEFFEFLDNWKRVPLTINQLYLSLEWEMQVLRPHESPYFAAYEVAYNKDYHFPEYFQVRPVPGTSGGLTPTKITAFEDLRGK